jgi:hypothetical protein
VRSTYSLSWTVSLSSLWNRSVYYLVQKTAPLEPVPGEFNKPHELPSNFLVIYFKCIHTSTPKSPKWCLHFRVSDMSRHSMYATCLAHLISIDTINLISGGEYKLWSSLSKSFIQPSLTLPLCRNIIFKRWHFVIWYFLQRYFKPPTQSSRRPLI